MRNDKPENSSSNQGSERDGNLDQQKFPPIFISGVENLRPLQEELDTIAKDEYTFKILPNNEVKIQPKISSKYLPIVEKLKKKNASFYTYQRKQDKSFKAVLKNMHPSVDIEDLKGEIEKHNDKVTRITNITQYLTQKPLPMFFVDIEVRENNKTI